MVEREGFSAAQRWLLLAAFTLLVLFRLPEPWVHGRFQDEEATVFLAYAWHYPWLHALFRPFAGYWNLGANAATVVTAQLVKGGVLPLEQAPYLTMTIGLASQLLPAVLVLTTRTQWLQNRAALILALLIIAASPVTEEVFFNVLHIQFHLALCAALILAIDVPDGRSARIAYGLLLFAAPLCGPGAIVLLPLFALRVWVDRDRRRAEQLAWLGAGTAVQLALFYGPSPMRGHWSDPATIAATMLVRPLALRVAGPDIANKLGDAIYASHGGVTWWIAVAVGLALIAGLIAISARRRDGALWLVLGALASAVTSLGFGMVKIADSDPFNVLRGERYNFLPLVLLGLALVVLATRPGGRRERGVFVALGTLMLVSGAYYYSKTMVSLTYGPPWPAEVAAWRKDHNHPLAVWPGKYAADLSDRVRPCSPVGPDPAQSTDPRYCESGWTGAFYREK